MIIPGYDDVVLIAHGGFASVYRARQQRYQRDVAIKVLHQAWGDDRDRRRFERECATMGRLTGHPHIVTILDSGFTADGRAYLTSPYYPRGSLGQRLAEGGPFPVTAVLRVGVALAGALETAHTAGILHRDLKPENVLLSVYDEPALTDFGIAAIVHADGASSTQTTQAFTVTHAPPEVLEGSRATVASDVYSLGSTLWTLMVGHPPFGTTSADEGLIQRVLRVQQQPVPPIARDDVPDALERVLAAALAKSPDERPQSAMAFGRSLQEIQRQLGEPVTDLRAEHLAPAADVGMDGPATMPVDLVADASADGAPSVEAAMNDIEAAPVARAPGWAAQDRWRGRTAIVDPAHSAAAAAAAAGAAHPTPAPPPPPPPPLAPLAPPAPPAAPAPLPPPASTPPASRPSPSPSPAPHPAPAARRRARGPLIVTGLAVLALLVLVGAAVLVRSTRDNASGPSTTSSTEPVTTTAPTTQPPTSPTTAPTTAAPTTTAPTTVPRPTTGPGTAVVPPNAPPSAVQATTVAQDAANALAAGNWDRARALIPSLGGTTNEDLARGWGGLETLTAVLTDWNDAGASGVTLRLGEVAHERNTNGTPRTNLYCVTWTVNGGRIVAMADQQVVGAQPWRDGQLVAPADAVEVLRGQCRPL